MLALNCNLTKMSIIDINGVLTFFDLTAKATGGGANTVGEHLSFERKASSSAARSAVLLLLPVLQHNCPSWHCPSPLLSVGGLTLPTL